MRTKQLYIELYIDKKGIHVYSMVTNYVYTQMQWRSTLYSANFVRKTLSSSVNHVRLDSAKAV